MRKEMLPDLIAELQDELELLGHLAADIEDVNKCKPKSQRAKAVYEESLALKLHNFYTGCERIFQKIADDINGGVPSSFDWHKRLLKSMSLEIENIRPAVISKSTLRMLEDFLAFRHVIRNIYGFEIDTERLQALINNMQGAYLMFKKDIDKFIVFLRKMMG
ncbi:MAG: hypothetical protein HY756_08000 [Nitrospirae bacterium]|nr:hypothetical protein [Nitrospirota bacterium]